MAHRPSTLAFRRRLRASFNGELRVFSSSRRPLGIVSLLAAFALTACQSDQPEFLDSSASRTDVIAAVGAKFCSEGRLRVQTMANEETIGSCTASGSNDRLMFRVFGSRSGADAYERSRRMCGRGLYQLRGPTWIAITASASDAAQIRQAGATTVSCSTG